MKPIARRWMVLAPLVVLLVPIVWSWPSTVRHERTELRTYAKRDRAEGDFLAPFVRYVGAWPEDTELAQFARLVQRRVPPDGLISAAGFENTTWVRSVAFAVAPRQIVAEGDSGWVVFHGAGAAPPGVDTTGGWHVGDYWLVAR